jgi:hypothetical protein
LFCLGHLKLLMPSPSSPFSSSVGISERESGREALQNKTIKKMNLRVGVKGCKTGPPRHTDPVTL